jgi:hypothetical protein
MCKSDGIGAVDAKNTFIIILIISIKRNTTSQSYMQDALPLVATYLLQATASLTDAPFQNF